MDGFERFAQGHLITLFSATNYCGTAGGCGGGGAMGAGGDSRWVQWRRSDGCRGGGAIGGWQMDAEEGGSKGQRVKGWASVWRRRLVFSVPPLRWWMMTGQNQLRY